MKLAYILKINLVLCSEMLIYNINLISMMFFATLDCSVIRSPYSGALIAMGGWGGKDSMEYYYLYTLK